MHSQISERDIIDNDFSDKPILMWLSKKPKTARDDFVHKVYDALSNWLSLCSFNVNFEKGTTCISAHCLTEDGNDLFAVCKALAENAKYRYPPYINTISQKFQCAIGVNQFDDCEHDVGETELSFKGKFIRVSSHIDFDEDMPKKLCEFARRCLEYSKA